LLNLVGTFFVISRNNSGQSLASNSTQNFTQSSSLQNSSSVFSSISSQSSQNSSNFSNSQNQNSAISKTNQKTDQIYTNSNYPSLKINYDDSWKIKEKTSKSSFEGLANQEIILTKDKTTLIFRLEIGLPIDGSGGDPKYSVAQAGLFYRLKDKDNKFDYSIENKSFMKENMIGKIKTNLKVSDFPDYKNSIQAIHDENYIVSSVYATLEGSDQKVLAEADQIVANSNFGTALN